MDKMFGQLLLLLVCLSFSSAQADVGVSPMIVDLTQKEADTEISVKNFDTKNNAYVEITPYRVLNPANHADPKKLARHPETDGLLVFPAKMILLPGQTQFARIVRTAKSVTSDQVYEIDFIPKVSTHLITQKNSKGLIMGIRVIVGYGARVIIRPDKPVTSVSVRRNKQELVIKNTGNTALNITSCTQQISNKKTEILLPAYTLYANQIITRKLSENTPVTLKVNYLDKTLEPYID